MTLKANFVYFSTSLVQLAANSLLEYFTIIAHHPPRAFVSMGSRSRGQQLGGNPVRCDFWHKTTDNNELCCSRRAHEVRTFLTFLCFWAMGKTLQECYEVLGLDNGATEGIFSEKCCRLCGGVGVNSFHVCSDFRDILTSLVCWSSFASLEMKLSFLQINISL